MEVSQFQSVGVGLEFGETVIGGIKRACTVGLRVGNDSGAIQGQKVKVCGILSVMPEQRTKYEFVSESLQPLKFEGVTGEIGVVREKSIGDFGAGVQFLEQTDPLQIGHERFSLVRTVLGIRVNDADLFRLTCEKRLRKSDYSVGGSLRYPLGRP